MGWATVQDIRDRWLDGELPYTDEQVLTLVEDAEDIISAEFPSLEAKVAGVRCRRAVWCVLLPG